MKFQKKIPHTCLNKSWFVSISCAIFWGHSWWHWRVWLNRVASSRGLSASTFWKRVRITLCEEMDILLKQVIRTQSIKSLKLNCCSLSGNHFPYPLIPTATDCSTWWTQFIFLGPDVMSCSEGKEMVTKNNKTLVFQTRSQEKNDS